MSWTATATNVAADKIDEITSPMPGLSDESLAQLAAAKLVATELVHTGRVGDPNRHTFNVTLSGHANPGHEPVHGWSNDCIAVTVSQTIRARQ